MFAPLAMCMEAGLKSISGGAQKTHGMASVRQHDREILACGVLHRVLGLPKCKERTRCV